MKWLTFAFGLLVIAILISANLGVLPQAIRNLYDFPGGDKLGHFLLFGLLGLLVNLSARRARPYPQSLRIGLSLSLFLAIGVALEEWSQALFPTRTSDLGDLAASLAGMTTGGLLAWMRTRREPTPDPKVNALLRTLLAEVRKVLGSHFIGLYIEGSVANGGFDTDSDVDFVVVTDRPVTEELFAALQSMHDRIARLDTPWAIQLEGSYIPREALRRHDPACVTHPNLERGSGERLKPAVHDQGWDVHRWVLRKRGIAMTGPKIQTLIDPVSPEQLRRAMLPTLSGWGAYLLEHPEEIRPRAYQAYIVLTLCRILYTLGTGRVASKTRAAAWALKHADPAWQGVIQRALYGRSHPGEPIDPADVEQTQGLIRYVTAAARPSSGNHPV
jgi:VanZ family protein/predicted nucleotidyltransferase